MIALPLALSLSNTVTDVGAIAAFAALLGIAVLSLLVFAQAREIKRLREWAGRAPERAAEMEQRVSAEAAARLQRGEGTAAPPAARVPAGARVVPRKTPLVSAPVSTAVNATVAAVVPGGASPAATGPSVPPVEGTPPGAPATPGVEGSSPAVPSAAAAAAAPPAAAASAAAREGATTPEPPAQAEAAEGSGVGEQDRGQQAQEGTAAPAPAPATAAAARAAGVTPRSPLPPSPADPSPAGVPVAAARRVPSRTAGAAFDAPPRSPSSSSRGASAAAAAAAAGRPATRPATAAGASGVGGPRYYKPERSSRRGVALIAGGTIVGVLVLILAVTALKGGGSKAATSTQSSVPAEARQTTSSHKRTSAPAPAAGNPAETPVAVLNGTGTAGLAHHLAADLQQSGYTQAVALAGVPPGTHSTTVVEYVHGHRADAQEVARKLNVTKVQAIEAAIASLAGSSTVVVLAGADQASLLGGGGAQSNGEPAAGTTPGQ